jgi:hypothetical protein
MAEEKKLSPEQVELDRLETSSRGVYLSAALAIVLVGGFLAWRYIGDPGPSTAPTETLRPSLTTARFTSIEGSVRVKPFGQVEWKAANARMTLRTSDLVQTRSASTAEIEFFDGTVIHVRPDSLITIEESVQDPSAQQRKVALAIESGVVNYQKTTPGRTEVSTRNLTLVQGGPGEGSVGVGESGEADVKLFGGEDAEVETSAGTTVALAANEAVRVDAAGQAGDKVVLPPAPRLVAPPHDAEVAHIEPANARTVLEWAPVETARAYHVMLDYSAQFNRPLVDQRAVQGTSFEVQGLEEGRYFWRVASVAGGDAEGDFSDAGRFELSRAPAPPPGPRLRVEALDVRGNILQVRGRTDPGCTVTVNGQPVEVRANGSFGEFIALGGAGRQQVVIRSRGPNGGVSEETRAVEVGI